MLLKKTTSIWTLLFLAVQNSSIGDLVNIFYILCVPQQTLWSLIYIKPLLLGSKKSNSYKQNSSNLYIFGWFCIRINVFNDDEMVECISIPTDLVCWVMNHDDLRFTNFYSPAHILVLCFILLSAPNNKIKRKKDTKILKYCL